MNTFQDEIYFLYSLTCPVLNGLQEEECSFLPFQGRVTWWPPCLSSERGYLGCSEGLIDASSGHKTQKNFIDLCSGKKCVLLSAKYGNFIYTHNGGTGSVVSVSINLLTKLRRTMYVASMARNSFIPSSKVELSLGRFSRNSRSRHEFLWTLTPLCFQIGRKV
jgi:hypothetical protein